MDVTCEVRELGSRLPNHSSYEPNRMGADLTTTTLGDGNGAGEPVRFVTLGRKRARTRRQPRAGRRLESPMAGKPDGRSAGPT